MAAVHLEHTITGITPGHITHEHILGTGEYLLHIGPVVVRIDGASTEAPLVARAIETAGAAIRSDVERVQAFMRQHGRAS